MLILETYINRTLGNRFGNSEPYEPYTEDIGELFRAFQREYGRCTGYVFIDAPNGLPVKVGWTFERKERYTDTGEPYIREVWVSLLDKPEVRGVIEPAQYHDLSTPKKGKPRRERKS